MANLNLAGFKKLKEDKKTVTMGHPMGHSITILKSKVPALQREKLKRLPLHLADGDPDVEAPQIDTGTDIINSGPVSEDQFSTPQQTSPVAPDAVGSYTFDPVTNSSREPAMAPQYEPNTQASSPPVQASAQTPSQSSSQTPNGLDSINAGSVYGKELSGIQGQARAEANLATAQAQIEHQHQADLQTAQNNWQKSSQAMLGDVDSALQDYKNGHIDSSHYLENMGTGQKVATAIGLLLGGFSAGYSKTGVNPAADWLNSQIGRDIDAQKLNQNNKLNVYNGYLEKYKNAAVADQMARATQLGIYKSQIEEAAAKAGTPLAIAKGNILSGELQQKILPLINNAHLIHNFDQFNGVGGNADTTGTEAQYKVALNAAQTLNPDLYKEQQSKYVPSVGIAAHPVSDVDRERLTSINALIPLIDKAQLDAKRFGYFGAYSPKNQADALSDKEALTASLGQLTKNNRLNDNVYNNYGAQVGGIGGHDIFGGETETLKRLKDQATMDRNSAITSAGIKPFANALAPTALTPDQDSKLQIFIKNNPGVPQDKALGILQQKGIIKGG